MVTLHVWYWPASRGNEEVWRVPNTNQANKGLISADRSNKATLQLTIPRSKFKSYAKDLSFPISEIVIQQPYTAAFPCSGHAVIA